MPFEANQRYFCTVLTAGLVESGKGTVGIELLLSNDMAGETTHTLWLSEKAKERAAEVLAEFGVTAEDLKAPFWRDGCQALVGQVANCDMKGEVYNGETRVRVGWIHGPLAKPRTAKAASPQAIAAAQRLFGGKTTSEFI